MSSQIKLCKCLRKKEIKNAPARIRGRFLHVKILRMDFETSHQESEKIDPLVVGQICHDAYRQFGERRRMMTHEVGSYPYCNEVCDLVISPLVKQFPENLTRIMGRTLDQFNGHTFIEIEDGSDIWVLDPTWQQFINKEIKRRQIPEKPSVLWVKKSDIAAELKRLEVPEHLHHMWLQAKPVREYRKGKIKSPQV